MKVKFSSVFIEMQSVGYRVGVTEPFLMRMAHGVPICKSNGLRDSLKRLPGQFGNQLGINSSTMLSDEQTLRVCKRFYVALILSRLVQVSLPFFSPCQLHYYC